MAKVGFKSRSIWFRFHVLFLRFHLFIFREKGREGEKHQCVVDSHTPPTGDLAATQACALTGNRTSDPLVYRPALNLLSHTSQGRFHVLNKLLFSHSTLTLRISYMKALHQVLQETIWWIGHFTVPEWVYNLVMIKP